MNGQLLKASQRGDVDACRALLAAGAQVNETNSDGQTALMTASLWGSVDVCNALIVAGANVKAADSEGLTALMWASRWGHGDVCSALIAAGANMEAVYSRGGRLRLGNENLVTEARRLLRAPPTPLAVAAAE